MNRAKNAALAKPTDENYAFGFAPVSIHTWSEHGAESIHHFFKLVNRPALKDLIERRSPS